MDHPETPDMVYGRLLEAAHISGYTFERVCEELEWLLTDDRWRQIGPGYAEINAFLRSVDFSAFNLQDKRPQLVRRIKELQPEASNRAIAEAIGVGKSTIARDVAGGPDGPLVTQNGQAGEPQESSTGPVGTPPRELAEAACALPEPTEAEDEDLPAFLTGEEWSLRERAHAFAVYLGLPDEVRPTVAALLEQGPNPTSLSPGAIRK